MREDPGSAPVSSRPRGRSLAIAAGVVAPVVLETVFTAAGAVRPGYHATSNFISELSLGPSGWVQKANFLVAGALVLGFSRAVRRAFAGGPAAAAAVALVGVGLLGAGVFDTDPFPVTDLTAPGVLHAAFAGLCFASMTPACLLLARRFRRDPAWRAWAAPTTAVGAFVGAVYLLVILTFPLPRFGPLVDLTAWIGLIQRVAQAPFFAWMLIFALRLWTLPDRP